jgi:hypothetical protein
MQRITANMHVYLLLLLAAGSPGLRIMMQATFFLGGVAAGMRPSGARAGHAKSE